MKVIPTDYRGRPFRSMTEARWAIFMDVLGIKWNYEIDSYSLGYGLGYIPDFYLPELKAWLEVKGEMDELSKRKISEFARQDKKPIVIGYPDIEFKSPDLTDPEAVNFDPPSEDDTLLQCPSCGKAFFSKRAPWTVCPVCGTKSHPHEAIGLGAITDIHFLYLDNRFKGKAQDAFDVAISAQIVRGQDGHHMLQIRPPRGTKVCLICGGTEHVHDVPVRDDDQWGDRRNTPIPMCGNCLDAWNDCISKAVPIVEKARSKMLDRLGRFRGTWDRIKEMREEITPAVADLLADFFGPYTLTDGTKFNHVIRGTQNQIADQLKSASSDPNWEIRFYGNPDLKNIRYFDNLNAAIAKARVAKGYRQPKHK